MAKYLLLWKLDRSRYSDNPRERGAGWSKLMEVVKKDLEKGGMKDWGVFAGEGRGYSVFEGSAEDLHLFIQKYIPFVIFETHPVIDAGNAHEVIKKLA